MSDAYWRFAGAPAQLQPPSSNPTVVGKRPRTDYETTGGHELPNFYPHQGVAVPHAINSVDSINASYEHYLRSMQNSAYGGQSCRPSGGVSGHLVNNPLVGIGGIIPGPDIKDMSSSFAGGRANVPLPPDASSTLYVEGLPSTCTRREVAHIFRPFVGYKEVRLVSKESKNAGRDPLLLCFVDFASPAHAATALDALQGYKFDEFDRDSVNLRLQFARFPGARSGGMHRGKH